MRTAVVWLSVGVSLSALVLAGAGQSDLDWNSVRAAVPVAWSQGLHPYVPPPPDGDGPLWANIYPPLGFVLQLPVAAAAVGLSLTPLSTIRLLQAWSALWLLLPLLLPAALPPHRKSLRVAWPAAGTALTVVAAATVAAQPLEDVTLLVHVDAFALGLSLLATWCVTRGQLISAAVLTAAALLTKQTCIGLLPALAAVIACTRGGRPALMFAALAAGVSTAGYAVSAGLFGQAFWAAVFAVPARHPLRGDVVALVREAAAVAGVPAAGMLLALLLIGGRSGASWRAAGPYLAVAVALLPTGLLGFMKFGGGANNLAWPLVHLLAAVVAAMAAPGAVMAAPESAMVAPGPARSPSEPVGSRRWPSVALLAAALAVLTLHLPRLAGAPSLRRPSQHDVAFHLLRDQPGLYVFPWLPLSHLLAERRIVHHGWGVLDRMAAGGDRWTVTSVLPEPQPLFLCFFRPPDDNDGVWRLHRADYPHRIDHPALPGWFVFTRASGSTAPP
ncbi:MAG: hypothetical protein ACK4PI_04735 [Tepidisphaerales bacterium]